MSLYLHMPKSPGVYVIINTINGKKYIGSTNSIYRRNYEHQRGLDNQRHENPHLKHSWNKYGANAFKSEVIEILEGSTQAERKNREYYWINYYRTFDRSKGYNEDKRDLNNKKEMSEETKAKLSSARKGMKFTEEHKENIRKARARQVFTKEHRKNQSERQKGRLPSKATTEGARVKNSRWFEVVSPEGDTQVIKNLCAFCRENGLLRNKMSEVSKGLWKQYKGWRCKRL